MRKAPLTYLPQKRFYFLRYPLYKKKVNFAAITDLVKQANSTMTKEPLTLKEICAEVSADFKRRRITHQQAAEKIGTTRQTVANQLSGKKRFSTNMAQKFSDALGYNAEFLLFGTGNLYKPGFIAYIPGKGELPQMLMNSDDPIMRETKLLSRMDYILKVINNKVAIECFEAAYREDWEESDRLVDILVKDFCYDIPVLTSDPKITKAFREMREFFRKAEIESAKELVQIEQRAAQGEVVDVDAEMERFKKKLLIIKNAYSDNQPAAAPAEPQA